MTEKSTGKYDSNTLPRYGILSLRKDEGDTKASRYEDVDVMCLIILYIILLIDTIRGAADHSRYSYCAHNDQFWILHVTGASQECLKYTSDGDINKNKIPYLCHLGDNADHNISRVKYHHE